AREHCWVPVNDLRPADRLPGVSTSPASNATAEMVQVSHTPVMETPPLTTIEKTETDLLYVPVWEAIKQPAAFYTAPISGKHVVVTGDLKDDIAIEMQH